MKKPDSYYNRLAAAAFAFAIITATVGYLHTRSVLSESRDETQAASKCEGKNALDHAACRRKSTE